MPTIHNLEALQKFIYAVEYGEFASIDSRNSTSQSQSLDYFMQLSRYCTQPDENISGLHVHPEFFVIDNVKRFFADLFFSLDESLRCKAEKVFQSCYAFIIDFEGPSASRLAMYELIENLKKRFPHLGEIYDKAIAAIITEFFRPTIGEFLNQHENSVTHLKINFPAIYAFFVAPLNSIPFTERKLFNFYCNPWIYHKITNYLAYHALLSSPEIAHEHLERPLQQLEECLQTIRSQTNDESWQELIRKAHKLCEHSAELEAFATESSGLSGEIKAAAQVIKNNCHSKDVLAFLPEKKGGGKNCDLLVIRHKTGDRELIECKAKLPRHGLDPKTAGDAQVWDDFFNNFTNALSLYLHYLQKAFQPILGLKLTKCFPLCFAFEGSNYGVALPLINDVLQLSAACNIPLNEWSSEQKLTHLLHALFLRPSIYEPCCVQLPSDGVCLKQRQQATEEVLQKVVNRILCEATKQLEEAYQHQTAEGYHVLKMYVALDLALSYRLLQDPFSYYDGNIEEVAEKVLHDMFQPFKTAFAQKNFNLDLLIIRP